MILHSDSDATCAHPPRREKRGIMTAAAIQSIVHPSMMPPLSSAAVHSKTSRRCRMETRLPLRPAVSATSTTLGVRGMNLSAARRQTTKALRRQVHFAPLLDGEAEEVVAEFGVFWDTECVSMCGLVICPLFKARPVVPTRGQRSLVRLDCWKEV